MLPNTRRNPHVPELCSHVTLESASASVDVDDALSRVRLLSRPWSLSLSLID